MERNNKKQASDGGAKKSKIETCKRHPTERAVLYCNFCTNFLCQKCILEQTCRDHEYDKWIDAEDKTAIICDMLSNKKTELENHTKMLPKKIKYWTKLKMKIIPK